MQKKRNRMPNSNIHMYTLLKLVMSPFLISRSTLVSHTSESQKEEETLHEVTTG